MSHIVQIILYLGALQGMLLSIFLFSIKSNIISNKLLGLLTLFWGIIVGSFALQEEGMYIQFPHLLKVFSTLLLLIFPLLFLQVKYLVSKHNHFERSDLWHFVPWLVVVLLNFDFYISSGEEKLFLIHDEILYYFVIDIISDEVIAIQGVVYSIFALMILSKYDKKIKDYQSNTDKLILKFQYIGISLSLFAWIIGIIGIHLEYFHIDVSLDIFIFVYLILVLIIYIISYSALKAPEIYKLDKSQVKTISNQNEESGSGQFISIQEVEEGTNQEVHFLVDTNNEIINTRLLDYLKIKKPYLNPELSLQELADKLEITRHSLSIVINQTHKKNFYEFINQYRVEEVKIMMSNPQNKNYKLMSLAYDAGFNSKASFNRIFKQMTLMTPTQFVSTHRDI